MTMLNVGGYCFISAFMKGLSGKLFLLYPQKFLSNANYQEVR